MRDDEAAALLRPALGGEAGGAWADLGAGGGTFTRALASLLGPGGKVIAVDSDAVAVRALRQSAERGRGQGAAISVLHADVSRPLELAELDGVLIANVLHFLRDAVGALALTASYLRPGGRLVLVEYEGRRASPWVPYPVSFARFAELAREAGLAPPEVVARRPSAYGGEMYVAVARRVEPGGTVAPA